MAIFVKLKAAVKDVATLEVATLTSDTGLSLEHDMTDDQKTQLADARTAVATTKTAYETNATPANKTALTQALDTLSDVEKSIGLYDPTNIFSRIQVALGTSSSVELVAYTRFELDGDSVNYINRENESLVGTHTQLVATARESRAALFNTVKSVISGDE